MPDGFVTVFFCLDRFLEKIKKYLKGCLLGALI